jgi:hypothetical protein
MHCQVPRCHCRMPAPTLFFVFGRATGQVSDTTHMGGWGPESLARERRALRRLSSGAVRVGWWRGPLMRHGGPGRYTRQCSAVAAPRLARLSDLTHVNCNGSRIPFPCDRQWANPDQYRVLAGYPQGSGAWTMVTTAPALATSPSWQCPDDPLGTLCAHCKSSLLTTSCLCVRRP